MNEIINIIFEMVSVLKLGNYFIFLSVYLVFGEFGFGIGRISYFRIWFMNYYYGFF